MKNSLSSLRAGSRGIAALAVAVVASASLPTLCLAQQVAQPSYTSADIASFNGGPDTLIDAIRHIEQTSGGKVLDIRYSGQKGMTGWQAVVLQDRQVNFVRVESGSGNVLRIDERSTPVWMLSWRGKADVKFANIARVPLTDAIRTAEQAYSNSPAVAAGIARSASNPESEVHAYNVLVDIRGSARRIAIDDATGKIIADPQALADRP